MGLLWQEIAFTDFLRLDVAAIAAGFAALCMGWIGLGALGGLPSGFAFLIGHWAVGHFLRTAKGSNTGLSKGFRAGI